MSTSIDDVIERERVSRRCVVQLRRLIQEFGQAAPEKLTADRWQGQAVAALKLAESSLEWGLSVSRQLKSVLVSNKPDNEDSETW